MACRGSPRPCSSTSCVARAPALRSRLEYIGPPPGYVADQPTYGINFGARAQYYDYNGCWANYAYGGTASPVAANRYYLNKQALDGRTPQPPIMHGGTVPYCGTI